MTEKKLKSLPTFRCFFLLFGIRFFRANLACIPVINAEVNSPGSSLDLAVVKELAHVERCCLVGQATNLNKRVFNKEKLSLKDS